jgi:hypothetical protein
LPDATRTSIGLAVAGRAPPQKPYRNPMWVIVVGPVVICVPCSGTAAKRESDAHSGFNDFGSWDGFGSAVGSSPDV